MQIKYDFLSIFQNFRFPTTIFVLFLQFLTLYTTFYRNTFKDLEDKVVIQDCFISVNNRMFDDGISGKIIIEDSVAVFVNEEDM